MVVHRSKMGCQFTLWVKTRMASDRPYVSFAGCGHDRRISKLAHASCLVGRELAFDSFRAKRCLPFLAGHWDVRNTVADKVHIAFRWLGRFSKASVKQGNRRGNSTDSDLPLVAILTSASIAVAPCWRAIC